MHDWEIFNGLGQAIAARKGIDIKFRCHAPDKLVMDLGIQRGPYSADRWPSRLAADPR